MNQYTTTGGSVSFQRGVTQAAGPQISTAEDMQENGACQEPSCVGCMHRCVLLPMTCKTNYMLIRRVGR